ncbi:sugar ABC transporter substrate-binding protein [Clostridium brassicae]|uniref:Maltodextrin-binding protein n=1 Tax=Clostridium brassicae TaxID=2999072 RepID=A0ABT4DBG7_9CLOT|nr:maltose ABC transporter substrate-binding protein [Clostridium brassicae]MCY6958501.1 maltose ABC transporter substrate-binding protein [Clostridium brassicae]
MKKKGLLAALMVALVTTSLFTGCGKSKGADQLTIWTKLPEKEVPVLQKAADKWAEKAGKKVNVIRDDGDFQAFLQAANSSQGPDIYFGSAHNQLASYQKAGLLTEIPEKYIEKSKYINDRVWDAVSLEGKTYAIPISFETTALYYNKDLVKEAPKTMEDLIKLAAAKGKNSFQFNITDQYTDLGFPLTNGGYIFKKEGDKFNVNDIGLANEGAKQGFKMLQDFVVKYKFMPADIKGDIALTNFKEGKTMFYISGPWDIAGLKEKGVNFGVIEIPSIAGKPFTPMSGVQCGFVSAKSSKQDLALECLNYLVGETQQGLYEKGKIPVTKEMLNKDEVKKNEYVQAFVNSAKNAIPMPNIEELNAVWKPMENIQRILKGEDVNKVAKDIVDGIKKGIQVQNQ